MRNLCYTDLFLHLMSCVIFYAEPKLMEFSWAISDELVLGPSVRKEKFNGSVLHLSFLRPQFDFENCYVRQLIHEFQNIFTRLRNLQKLNSENGNVLNSSDLLEISIQYKSVIRSVILKLKKKIENVNDENLLCSLKEIELIWSLVDVLLLRSADSLPSQDLVQWSKWNFLENFDVDKQFSTFDENVFKMVYKLLLLGCPDEARNLLLQHPRKSDPVFLKVDELLTQIPSFSDKNDWLIWQNLCRQKLGGKHFLAYPELEIVVKILCGDTETFKDLLVHLDMKWYQVLIGKLYFSAPFIKIYELSDVAMECLKWQLNGDDNAAKLDDILLSILELDLLAMLKLSSEYFNNVWFVAHLADLLYFAGSIELGSMKETIDLREKLLLNYANCLVTHQSLWQLSVDYFVCCPTFGKHSLKLNLERISCVDVSGKKILKILEVCRKYEFFDVARSISKEQCIKALKENDLNKALSWCLQTKDSGLASYLVQKFLQLHGRSGLLHSLYLLDNLGEFLLLCPALTFLGKYREFCNLRKTQNFKEAGTLITHLITSRVAPLQFWSILLEDLLPLLRLCNENSVLTTSELHSLMSFIEDVDNEQCVMKNTNLYVEFDKDKDNYGNLVSDLRLALVLNLGRAIVASN